MHIREDKRSARWFVLAGKFLLAALVFVGLGTMAATAQCAVTLYVANSNGNAILEFPAGASGNVAPGATISGSSTGFAAPSAVFLVDRRPANTIPTPP